MAFVQYISRPTHGNTASALDFSALNSLKQGVRSGADASPEAQKQVLQQFEALFIQQMLKQARQVSVAPGAFDSQQTRLAQSMSDEQMSLQLATPGIGLAQALLDQIQAAQGTAASGLGAASTPPELASSRLPGLTSRIGDGRRNDASSIGDLINLLTRNPLTEKIYSAIKGAPDHIQSFVSKMSTAARVAANQSGVPEKLLLSQAALESGWGKREILRPDGSTSYNLFGIKATPGWKSDVVHLTTTECEDRGARQLSQPSRAIGSIPQT